MEEATLDQYENFMFNLKFYLKAQPDESEEDLLFVALDVIHAVCERARDGGKPLMVIARGG